MKMSDRSSRAVSAMKMFSASESTQAITPRARSIPACLRISSSEGWLSIRGAPVASADSRLAGFGSITTYLAPATRRSRATWRPTRPKPQTM